MKCQGGCWMEKGSHISIKHIRVKHLFVLFYLEKHIFTWVGPVWDSCWAPLCLSLQVFPPSPFHPLFPASSRLFPANFLKHSLKRDLKEHTVERRREGLCWNCEHTPSTGFPSCSIAHGHQPRTDFWEKRELSWDPIIPCNIFRLHFSGVLAGGIRFSKSSSTEPVTEKHLSVKQLQHTHYSSWLFLKPLLQYIWRKRSTGSPK